MTKNEFYCRALLQIAGNSEFAVDRHDDGLTKWAIYVDMAATVLADIAEDCKAFDDEPDEPP